MSIQWNTVHLLKTMRWITRKYVLNILSSAKSNLSTIMQSMVLLTGLIGYCKESTETGWLCNLWLLCLMPWHYSRVCLQEWAVLGSKRHVTWKGVDTREYLADVRARRRAAETLFPSLREMIPPFLPGQLPTVGFLNYTDEFWWKPTPWGRKMKKELISE